MTRKDYRITEPEETPCAECGAMVHWLERFPQNRCLPCHAKAVDGQTPEEMREDIIRAFGG